MSIYQRFYVQTKYPRQVEQLIIDTLGGSAWLEANERGEYLWLVVVTIQDSRSILPERSYHGSPMSPVDGQNGSKAKRQFWAAASRWWRCETGNAQTTERVDSVPGWYWLPSIIDYGSVEAACVAKALYTSPFVELVAEDNEISADATDSVAWVIDSERYFDEVDSY
jgi:hypothetical protein